MIGTAEDFEKSVKTFVSHEYRLGIHIIWKLFKNCLQEEWIKDPYNPRQARARHHNLKSSGKFLNCLIRTPELFSIST